MRPFFVGEFTGQSLNQQQPIFPLGSANSPVSPTSVTLLRHWPGFHSETDAQVFVRFTHHRFLKRKDGGKRVAVRYQNVKICSADRSAGGVDGSLGSEDTASATTIFGAVGRGVSVTERRFALLGWNPRKSPTRRSTNWLMEMPLVSQYDLSRSYVPRLTLMLRRVCFFAI